MRSLHPGLQIAGLDISHLDQIAEHIGVLFFRHPPQLSQHLPDERDVLLRAGSSGIFLCELGRHEIVSEEREAPPFG